MTDPEVQVHGHVCSGDSATMPTAILTADWWHVTLVRAGCFRYRCSAGDVLADAATGLLSGPAEEYATTHPLPGGDTDTLVLLSETAMASVAGGDLGQLPLELHVTPALEREQRALVVVAGQPSARCELEERALVLVAALLSERQPARVAAGSPRTDRAARSVVDDARVVLMAEPDLPMIELAARLGCSPHHLSRLFTRHTGGGVAAYRMAVRATRAMAMLTGGHGNLAEVAAHAGYADQAHMSRALRSRFGATPSALRTELSS